MGNKLNVKLEKDGKVFERRGRLYLERKDSDVLTQDFWDFRRYVKTSRTKSKITVQIPPTKNC